MREDDTKLTDITQQKPHYMKNNYTNFIKRANYQSSTNPVLRFFSIRINKTIFSLCIHFYHLWNNEET